MTKKQQKTMKKQQKMAKKQQKIGKKASKNDKKAAKMVRKAVIVAFFLTVWGRCLTFSGCDEAVGAPSEPYGCCRRNQWVPPKKPMGAAEETDGFLGRNRWFPPRNPPETACKAIQ